MIGPRCADLIAEAVLAMEYRASAEDIVELVMPTLLIQKHLKKLV